MIKSWPGLRFDSGLWFELNHDLVYYYDLVCDHYDSSLYDSGLRLWLSTEKWPGSEIWHMPVVITNQVQSRLQLDQA